MASYREELEAWAASAGSDGCSHVPEFYRVCCLEHDYAYVNGQTMRGVVVTKHEADRRFRDCIQRHSSFRWLSPMSWWRWLAVCWFGRGVWLEDEDVSPSRALVQRAAALVEAERARKQIIRSILEDRT